MKCGIESYNNYINRHCLNFKNIMGPVFRIYKELQLTIKITQFTNEHIIGIDLSPEHIYR